MTKKTTNLKLTSYNAVTDSGSLVYNYINDVSGSATGENLLLIDTFAGQANSSLVNLSASIVTINNKLIFAPATVVTTGMSTSAIISPSGLSQSDYGKRSVSITLNTSASLLGGEMGFFRVPSSLNGWILQSAAVSCAGSSTSGNPTFSVFKYANNVNPYLESTGTKMSASITVAAMAFESSASEIVSTASSIFTENKVRVKCVVSGSSVRYATATLVFQKKP